MTKEQLKQAACEAIDRNRDRIFALGDAIYCEPELGYKEVRTAAKFKALLDELGYPYRDGVALTGVVSRRKGRSSRLNVAVMGELDAVISPSHPDSNDETGAVHACGHNCMIAALGGVAIALKEANLMEELDGDVSLMAVPAEECVEIEYRNRLRAEGKIHFLGGKQEFIRLGEMDDVDMMLMQHTALAAPGFKAGAGSNCNGFTVQLVRYIGREAHAGAAPFEGVNALNAAMLGLMGIHANRETFRDEDHIRVHPIITKGGDLVNVVPADVRLESYVRGTKTSAILDARDKVDRALRAGADAVGAKVEITHLPGYLPSILNDGLMGLCYENLKTLVGEDAQYDCVGFGGGSTDAGDISHLMPTLHAFFAGAKGGFHSEEFTVVDKELAYLTAAKALTMTVIDLLADGAETGLAIKQAYQPVFTKEEYLTKWGGLDAQ